MQPVLMRNVVLQIHGKQTQVSPATVTGDISAVHLLAADVVANRSSLITAVNARGTMLLISTRFAAAVTLQRKGGSKKLIERTYDAESQAAEAGQTHGGTHDGPLLFIGALARRQNKLKPISPQGEHQAKRLP